MTMQWTMPQGQALMPVRSFNDVWNLGVRLWYDAFSVDD
jgi:hypothetical protein